MTKLSTLQLWHGCLDAVCSEIEDWDLAPEAVETLCAQIHDEIVSRRELAAEQAAQDPETIAARNASYERDMIAAGRSHLIR